MPQRARRVTVPNQAIAKSITPEPKPTGPSATFPWNELELEKDMQTNTNGQTDGEETAGSRALLKCPKKPHDKVPEL